MNTDRIKQLAKKQGKTVTYICKLIERISEPFIVWGTVFVQTRRHSLP